MDMGLAVDLLQALGVVIDAQEAGRVGHPAGRSSRLRARNIAEQTALRCLRSTDSFTKSLGAGADAYDREMTYFSPLSLVQESEGIAADVEALEVESEGPDSIAMDR